LINGNNEEAGRFLSSFATLVRQTLNHSARKLIPLSDELELVKNYLEVEQKRLKNAFKYNIRIDSGIDAEQIMIPPTMIQPFVENSIWHGFKELKDRKGKLQINIYKSGGNAVIEIDDNGVGREQAEINKKRKKKYKSVSMEMIRRTMELFNKEGDLKLSMEVIDKTDEQGKPAGTKVILKISDVKQK
jgi:LytS/YehU family sensor histidine kinase